MPDTLARTERGFAIYADFLDNDQTRIQLIQSSKAPGDRVWISALGRRGDFSAGHLSPEQANTLADALLTWLREIGHTPLGEYRLLERGLAYENASSTIDTNCQPVSDRDEWFDTSDVNPHAGDAIADALLYLDLRGLLERDPENRNWVSVRAESEEGSAT